MPLLTLRPAPLRSTPLTTSTTSVLRHLDSRLVTALLRTAAPALESARTVVLLAEGRDGRRVSGDAREVLASSDATLLIVTGDRTRPPWVDALEPDAPATTTGPRVAWCSSADLADALDLALADGLPQARVSEHSRQLLTELVAYWEVNGLRELHDTVVVAGRAAWPEYLRTGAIISTPGPQLRGGTSYVGFSVDGAVAPVVPAVTGVHRGVRFTPAAAERHREKGLTHLADVIETSLAARTRSEGAVYDVVLLSAPDAETTVQLGAEVPDAEGAGRRAGWAPARRYAHLDELRGSTAA
ncbi:hypothetical protein [Quadrisphaera granulorum]|nr:hypothetical protein [Quadrisphaera granulorum]